MSIVPEMLRPAPRVRAGMMMSFWRSAAFVSTSFFTRAGGVSEGLYAGLNVGLGSYDEPERIHENRARVAGWFGAGAGDLATLYQIHSPDVVTVDKVGDGDRPKADSHVTATPGVVLGVLTADCGPILFADPDARVIGAAHAGWKGAFDGVLENTIAAMETLGARRENIAASLGPQLIYLYADDDTGGSSIAVYEVAHGSGYIDGTVNISLNDMAKVTGNYRASANWDIFDG